MRHFFKMGLLFFCGVLLSGCRKADFSSIDPNLPSDKWYSASWTSGTGSRVKFSSDYQMDFIDKADGLSGEDDVNLSGKAKYFNQIIRLGDSKFKITEG